MDVLDSEVQRERRSEMLREAEGHHARSHRTRSCGRARRFWKLAITWIVSR